MNKLHGEYGIKPLTLVDSVVADYAGIQEHKIALDFGTSALNIDIVQLRADFTSHVNDNSDPHGPVLNQSTVRTSSVETPVSSIPVVLPIKNSGAGAFTAKVYGDLEANNLTLSGYANITGTTTTNDLVVNGRFTVNGGYDISNANVVDYDVMQITPTTKTSPAGLVIAPDDEGQPEGSYTYTGDLIQAQKRINGVNSVAFRVDSQGNIYSYGYRLEIGGCAYTSDGSLVNASLPQRAPQYIATARDGFKYVAASNTPATDNTFVALKVDGSTPTFYANKNGDLYTSNRFKIGDSSWFTWDGVRNVLVHSTSISAESAPQYFKDSPIYLQATNKAEWKISNRESSVAFTYGNNTIPTVEFTQNAINAPTCDIFAKSITTSGPIVIAPGQYVDGVDISDHTHSGAAGMGKRLPATSVIGLQEFLDAHVETVQDIVGGMVDSGVENGISVTYTDATGKLNFDVSDFTISLAGDVTGSATVTDLNSVTITATVLDDSHNHTNLTGTTSQTFHVDSDGAGPRLRNSSGVMEVRNSSDSDYADLRVRNLIIDGGSTTIKSEVVTIADNIIQLNSNYSGSAPTENGGVEVNRGSLPAATATWNESTDKWEVGTVGDTSPVVTEASLSGVTNVECIQDIVGNMVSGNTENGISVSYNDSTNKLDFDVNDFTITLSGDVSGSINISNLVGGTLAASVLNSAKVGGLSIHSARNNEPNKVIRTDSDGYAQMGWINTPSGDMGATAIDRIYASNDAYIRYITPLNFANQVLALGSVKNSHTHAGTDITSTVAYASSCSGNSATATRLQTARSINGVSFDGSASITIAAAPTAHTHAGTDITGTVSDATRVAGFNVQRGASTFNSTSGRFVAIATMATTNYSVSITATGATGGNLGEVYVASKGNSGFYVYNTGVLSGVSFDWIVIG